MSVGVVSRLHLTQAAVGIAAAVVLAGCGASPPPPPLPADSEAELAWIDGATNLIGQLTDGVVVSNAGGSDIATARLALDNDDNLLAMVMANVSFGSCAELLHNVGVPNVELLPVATKLGEACHVLQRASRLFTRASVRDDPRALISASRISRKASPLLAEAQLTLDVLRADLARRKGS